MSVARRDKRDPEWIRCAKCGHKLGRWIGVWEGRNALPAIEIKCHSCREINYIMIGGNRNEGSERIG